MNVLNYILGIAGVYTSLWMKWNEVRMNEWNRLYVSNESSLVEVLYVEPSFLRSFDVKSMIPWSHGIWTNDMKNVMCYMQYVMCSVQDVMCCVYYDTYDYASYSNGMTFQIKIR